MSKKHTINNPHDKYFRSMMEYQEFSSAFFQTHLPKRLTSEIDYDTLALLKETHLDKSLQKTVNDLLFSCKVKGEDAYLSILVEHQSTPDKFIAFRIFHYLFSVLNSRLKQHPDKTLPPVYALLFYHGEHTPYPYSLDLLDSFDDPLGIMKEVLFQPVPIVDVNQIPDEQLQAQAWVGTLSMAMKHIRQPDLSAFALRILNHLPQLKTKHAKDMLHQLIVYLLNAGEIENIDKLIAIGLELPKPVRSELMTAAEKLEARGAARGKAEGSAETKASIAKKMLAEGASAAFIAKVTGLTLEEISKL